MVGKKGLISSTDLDSIRVHYEIPIENGIWNPQEVTLAPLPTRVLRTKPLKVGELAKVYAKIKKEVTEEQANKGSESPFSGGDEENWDRGLPDENAEGRQGDGSTRDPKAMLVEAEDD
ncbi:hypothetical protein ACLOJK_035699 [Asimina triloba]